MSILFTFPHSLSYLLIPNILHVLCFHLPLFPSKHGRTRIKYKNCTPTCPFTFRPGIQASTLPLSSTSHLITTFQTLIKFQSATAACPLIRAMKPRSPNRNSGVTGKSACPVIRGVFSRQIGVSSHARGAAENGRCLLTGRFNAPLPERFTRAANFTCFAGPSVVYIARLLRNGSLFIHVAAIRLEERIAISGLKLFPRSFFFRCTARCSCLIVGIYKTILGVSH